jgi:hypothetical protein
MNLNLRTIPTKLRRIALASAAAVALATPAFSQREVQTLNDGWRFLLQPAAPEFLKLDYNDESWEPVRVPHDWAISGPFDPGAHGSTGKLPWKGVGCYRLILEPDGTSEPRAWVLEFDGVMAFPKVYLNGILMGSWDYGYTPFQVDLTHHLKPGEPNVLLVEVDTQPMTSRWYPGAGIYRKVTLVSTPRIHFPTWATFVYQASPDDLKNIQVETRIQNRHNQQQAVVLELEVSDATGKVVASAKESIRLLAGDSSTHVSSIRLKNPVPWDIENPHLYSLKSTLRSKNTLIDSTVTRFGVRTLELTANEGLILNGRRVQLKGVNLHHDLGPIGAAFNRRAAQRQLEIMQSMGVNAIRTSHNPSASEVLELCDEMGLLVFNETFDKWDGTAGRQGDFPSLASLAEKHLEAHMLRDRNHPSLVVWSIGNEINPGPTGVTPANVALVMEIARKYDHTRMIGMGCHIPPLSYGGNFDTLDFSGWNYARRYANFREVYPDKPIMYSESASTVSTRGYYPLPLPVRHTDYLDSLQVSSYDLTAASWSDIPDFEFALMEQDDYVHGEFVWTGIDYIGEPTPYDAEATSSYFGIVDLCGFPKDRYYLYRSHWAPEKLTVHILPHWNWQGMEEQAIPVFVYTNGDEAELFLNGKSLGKRRKGELPDRPENRVGETAITASSHVEHHEPKFVADQRADTSWKAAEKGANQWLQFDFGKPTSLGYVGFEFDCPEKLLHYQILSSTDGQSWTVVGEKPISKIPQWGGNQRYYQDLAFEGRYLKIQFLAIDEEGRTAGIRRAFLYDAPRESDYYDVTYRYRLRWNEVPYEPGELKVVAYKDGTVIGENTMRTAGEPVALRLSADRSDLDRCGNDLAFITVEAYDANGVACPLADNLVQFEIDGPGEIVGVGNGNPMSLEPYVATQRSLFYGKAIVVVRALQEFDQPIVLKATTEGLKLDTVTLSPK